MINSQKVLNFCMEFESSDKIGQEIPAARLSFVTTYFAFLCFWVPNEKVGHPTTPISVVFAKYFTNTSDYLTI